MATTSQQHRYISCADTAKLVRRALKDAFPGVKFSVRSHTYSGGASIHVSWTDGPFTAEVDAVAKQYEGSGFDGMIDLKTSNEHWLRPDGRVLLHRSEIGHSHGQRAHFPRLTDDCELVHFMADYIFCERDLSPEAREAFGTIIAREAGVDAFSPNARYRFGSDMLGRCMDEYGSTLIWQYSGEIPSRAAITMATLGRGYRCIICERSISYAQARVCNSCFDCDPAGYAEAHCRAQEDGQE